MQQIRIECFKSCFNLMLVTALCACCSCSDLTQDNGIDGIPVTDIVLSDSEIYMNIGETCEVTAVVYPDNATDKSIKWTSRNEPVVVVNDGELIALRPGAAAICAESIDGKVKEFCIVRVRYPNPVTGVSLDKSQLKLFVGEEFTLIASVLPSDATNPDVIWYSSNERVASVDNGRVIAQSEGNATITVKTDDGTKTATCEVIVVTQPPVSPVLPEYIDEYGINHGKGVFINEIIWAPVNCGYHVTDYPYGKHYQWGRQYGQGLGDPYDKGQTIIKRGGVSNETGQDASNAEVFYTGENSPNVMGNLFSWEYVSGDILNLFDAYWGSRSHPCPVGWRVPSEDELKSLMNSNYVFTTDAEGMDVMIFDSLLTLPAAGCRSYMGQLIDVGKCGYYWSTSSEFSEIEYYYLGFSDVGEIEPFDGYRACGLSVRCVSNNR